MSKNFIWLRVKGRRRREKKQRHKERKDEQVLCFVRDTLGVSGWCSDNDASFSFNFYHPNTNNLFALCSLFDKEGKNVSLCAFFAP